MIFGGTSVKKSAKILTASLLSLMLLPFAANSEDNEQGASSKQRTEMAREERRAAWDGLSEEEKQAKREQMRAKREQKRAEWESMTPEQREAKRAEMREKWDSMTPEQQEAMKQRRQQRGQRGGKRQHEGQMKEPAE